MNRTEYQRNYMRDWRAKNPTSRVGKLEAVLREIANLPWASGRPSPADACDEMQSLARSALDTTNLSGAAYDRDGRFGG